jgi:hypothetical protein
MKKDKLSEINIIPEEYDTEHFDRLPCLKSMDFCMVPTERRFINGLIRYYRPANLLELGVYSGGGTVNILNAISDYDAKLLSVDILEQDNTFAIYKPLIAQTPKNKWLSIRGKDVSEITGKFKEFYENSWGG